MPCGWGVKAGMVRFVWGWQIKLCGYTRAISERFRDHLGIIKRYTNGLFTLLYFTYLRFIITRECGVIMRSVCLSVCLSVSVSLCLSLCNALTFESLNQESLFLVCAYVFGLFASSSCIKVNG